MSSSFSFSAFATSCRQSHQYFHFFLLSLIFNSHDMPPLSPSAAAETPLYAIAAAELLSRYFISSR